VKVTEAERKRRSKVARELANAAQHLRETARVGAGTTWMLTGSDHADDPRPAERVRNGQGHIVLPRCG
jgi:hypothetical protein